MIEYRHENRDLQRLSGLADELIRLDIDVLVAVTTNAAQAASKATKTVPIVFMGVTDPIATGLAESLARPGGNSTGVTNVAAMLAGKRLEILKETAGRHRPGGRAVGPPRARLRAPVGSQPGRRPRSSACSSIRWKPAAPTATRRSSRRPSRGTQRRRWVTLNPVANSNQRRSPNWRSRTGCRRSAPAATMRRTAA